MTKEEVAFLRLVSQQIIFSRMNSPKELVDWMGAMQAQDYPMVRWAIGNRIPGITNKLVEKAFDEGTILRTHLMRPTWHLVTAAHLHWLTELTAPQILATLRSRDKAGQLDQTIYEKTNFLIENALAGGQHLTREELVAQMDQAGIDTSNNRDSHFLIRAEIDQIICSGKHIGNKLTYALLRNRVPRPEKLAREEAVALLARKYFLSHGPATLQDFAWWSGLNLTDCRKGLAAVQSELKSEVIDQQTYWFSRDLDIPDMDRDVVALLPTFDEQLISYRDRSASLSAELNHKAVSANGIFRPTIVVNGEVVGLWKRATKNNRLLITTELYWPLPARILTRIGEEIERFGQFFNQPVVWMKEEK